MLKNKSDNPLKILYGEDYCDLVLTEIDRIKGNSNIPFTNEYVKTGISFLLIKAAEMAEGKVQYGSLKSLVSKSFGEASIYQYNC